MKRQHKETYRFNVYFNDTEILLSLKDGQEIKLESYERHEEGHSCERHYYSRNGDFVDLVVSQYASDCDGPMESHRDLRVDVNTPQLSWEYTITTGYGREVIKKCTRRPDWFEIDSYQRDYYAESMGY